jgi:hypothetical protein
MIDISIVIVSYNTKEFLKKCIMSIVQNAGSISYEVIVVDNASSDGSSSEISKLKSKIPNLKIISNRKNVGFSKANNQGVKISQESRYILFLNPDTIVQNQAIEKMVNFMDTHEDAGASTCKLVMLNGKIDDAIHRGFPTPWNSFSHFSGLEKLFPKSKLFAGYSLGWMDFNSIHEIDVLAGAFMLVRRKAGNEVDWWDEDYFFYGEDIDFCYMLHEKGWKIYYVPNIFITHYKGVSGGIKTISKKITTASDETRKRAKKWRFAAMKIFYNKHYKKKYPWIINFLVNLGISIKGGL